MSEEQTILTFLTGLTTLAFMVEGVKALIWAVIVAAIFKRAGIVVVRLEKKP